MTKRTEAEMIARYDAERSGAAYVKPADDTLSADEARALDILLDDEDEREGQPVPPVPAGYPTDRAMLFTEYGDVLISVDRRDGDTMICKKGEIGGTILPPEFALGLFKFFQQAHIKELMVFHWIQAVRANASPALLDVLDFVDAHFDRKNAA